MPLDNQVDSVLSADGRRPVRPSPGYRFCCPTVKLWRTPLVAVRHAIEEFHDAGFE